MQRGYFFKKRMQLDGEYDNYEDDEKPLPSRHRSKRKPPKPAEVLAICYEAIVEKQYHEDIAKRHNISRASVSSYSSKAKKNANFLQELYSK